MGVFDRPIPGLWQQKPEAWGPVELVQRGILDACNETVPYLFIPLWEMAGNTVIDYSKNKLVGVNDRGEWRNNGIYHPIDGSEILFTTISHGIGTGGFTWHAICIPRSLLQYSGLIGNGAYNPGFYTSTNSNGFGLYLGGVYATGDTLTLNTKYILTVRRVGTTLNFFKNGVKLSYAPTCSTSIGNDQTTIGASQPAGTNNQSLSDMSLAVCYNVGLSDDEIYTFHDNPYAAIQSRSWPSYFFVGGGAAPTTYIPNFMNFYRQKRV